MLETKNRVYYCIPRAALKSSRNTGDLDSLALLCDFPKLDTRTVYKNTIQESLRSEMLCKHEALLFLFLLFLRFSCLERKKKYMILAKGQLLLWHALIAEKEESMHRFFKVKLVIMIYRDYGFIWIFP